LGAASGSYSDARRVEQSDAQLHDRVSSGPRQATAPSVTPSATAAGPALTEQQTAIARQLSSIQQMVTQLTRESLQKVEDMPGELFQLYTELIDVEVEEDLARDLIHQLKRDAGAEKIADASASKARLRGMVEGEVRCAAPIGTAQGRRRVVALVGPTGVGKTTTIAKLAANFRLRDGIRMGLVTVDTYRIAAVEQLRTYAEIIDLPMKVVTSPREMRRALDELSGLDLVLIDTAGRSPRDELKIQELKSLLAEAQVDEVHLVLSLVASPKSLQATAEKFAPAGTTAMILTKLDEAVGMGSLLSVARRVPLPVSYLTTGQDVPDDIEHASARRVARLILGEESLFAKRKAG
jgi:flagellar biosynthesis protein FlhF